MFLLLKCIQKPSETKGHRALIRSTAAIVSRLRFLDILAEVPVICLEGNCVLEGNSDWIKHVVI